MKFYDAMPWPAAAGPALTNSKREVLQGLVVLARSAGLSRPKESPSEGEEEPIFALRARQLRGFALTVNPSLEAWLGPPSDPITS